MYVGSVDLVQKEDLCARAQSACRKRSILQNNNVNSKFGVFQDSRMTHSRRTHEGREQG